MVDSDVSYRIAGFADRPTLVLGNSLGTDSRLWTQQVGAWERDFRVICFEYPGHGSPAWQGARTMKAFAQRVASLLEALRVDAYSYCGLSMGGAIGMELALLHRSRMKRLVLSNTAAAFGPPQFWTDRGGVALTHGLAALADATIGRWFTTKFATEHQDVVSLARSMLMAVEPQGYAACCEAIGCFDFREQLCEIAQPTLVIAGSADSATTPDQAAELARAIPRSLYVELDTAHIGSLGAPQEFTRSVDDFLKA